MMESCVKPFSATTVNVAENYLESFPHHEKFIVYFQKLCTVLNVDLMLLEKPVVLKGSWDVITQIEIFLKNLLSALQQFSKTVEGTLHLNVFNQTFTACLRDYFTSEKALSGEDILDLKGEVKISDLKRKEKALGLKGNDLNGENLEEDIAGVDLQVEGQAKSDVRINQKPFTEENHDITERSTFEKQIHPETALIGTVVETPNTSTVDNHEDRKGQKDLQEVTKHQTKYVTRGKKSWKNENSATSHSEPIGPQSNSECNMLHGRGRRKTPSKVWRSSSLLQNGKKPLVTVNADHPQIENKPKPNCTVIVSKTKAPLVDNLKSKDKSCQKRDKEINAHNFCTTRNKDSYKRNKILSPHHKLCLKEKRSNQTRKLTSKIEISKKNKRSPTSRFKLKLKNTLQESTNTDSSDVTKKVDAIFTCSKCAYVTKKFVQLEEHEKRIHLTKQFKCVKCEKEFGFRKDLRRHMKCHGKAEHCCDVCGKMYKEARKLKAHKETHASGYIKPQFPCEQCSKSFSTKYVLAYHVRSEHLGIKPSYVCPTCGKSFAQKNSYVQHCNAHSGVKPFTCNTCEMQFSYEKSLKEHMFLHLDKKSFICKVCNKPFRQSSSLTIHLRIHKETRDYVCSMCGKGFSQRQSLIRHERIHAGEKPFECCLCGRFFGDSSVLRRHIISVHKKSPENWQQSSRRHGTRTQKNSYFIHECAKSDSEPKKDSIHTTFGDSESCESEKKLSREEIATHKENGCLIKKDSIGSSFFEVKQLSPHLTKPVSQIDTLCEDKHSLPQPAQNFLEKNQERSCPMLSPIAQVIVGSFKTSQTTQIFSTQIANSLASPAQSTEKSNSQLCLNFSVPGHDHKDSQGVGILSHLLSRPILKPLPPSSAPTLTAAVSSVLSSTSEGTFSSEKSKHLSVP